MVSVPELSTYSKEELARAGQISPALSHYLQLLNAPTTNPIDLLRQKRHRAWIETSLSIIFKKTTAEISCAYWSNKTIEVLETAWYQAELNTENICLISMGKLGALELNLSSDVDLFFVVGCER